MCFDLHPDLKKAHEEKRESRKKKRIAQKKIHDKKKAEAANQDSDKCRGEGI